MAEDQELLAPYLKWAVSTKFAYLEAEWFSVLLEVEKGAAHFATEAERSALAKLIWVAPAYRTPLREFKEEAITRFSAVMHQDALDALLNEDGSSDLAAEINKLGIKRIEFGTPAASPFTKGASETSARARSAATQPAVLGPSAIVAIIDDGLAFAHERFRCRNGQTRFKYFWNQDDTTGIGQPADFLSGREFSESDINGLASGIAFFAHEKYVFSVGERGMTKVPAATFDTLRIKMAYTQTYGALVTTRITYLHLAECYGAVARVRSKDNETSADFTQAAEYRRLANP